MRALVISLGIHLRSAVLATVVLGVLVAGVYPLVVWGLAQLIFPAQANGSLLVKDGKAVGSALLGQNFSAPQYFHPRPSAAGNGYDATSSGGSNLGPTSAKLIAGTTKAASTDAAYPAPADATANPAPADATAAAAASASAAAAAPQVVDYDGITLRVLHYCDDNGIPFTGQQAGKTVDLTAYKTADGWDEVKLITACNDGDHPLTVKAGAPIPPDAVTASASGLDPHISPANADLQVRRVAAARKLDPAQVRAAILHCTDGAGLFGDPGVNVLRLNLALDALR